MAFLLFLLANAALFIRPSELVPELGEVPLYLWLITAALIAALPSLIRELTPGSLRETPVTVCLLAMLPAIVLSFSPDLWIWATRNVAFDFAKIVLYYLLLVRVVDSERRLKIFLGWLAACITVAAALSLLHRAGSIDLPSLESLEQKQYDPATGEVISYPRLRSTGIFNDPNDFAMILVAGIAAAAYLVRDGVPAFTRLLWLGPIGICGYAFWLTRSRGGLLAFAGALAALAFARWGWRRALAALVVAAPVVVAGFASRGDAMETGTGQQRIQLWSEGLLALRAQPLFGIGYDKFVEEFGHVAHNSFVHTYTELGLFGGTAFFGVYLFAFLTLMRLRTDVAIIEDPESRRLLAVVMAIVAGLAVAQLSLSRAFVVPTYMAAGLAVVVSRVLPVGEPERLPETTPSSLIRMTAASIGFLIAIMIYVRFAARWS